MFRTSLPRAMRARRHSDSSISARASAVRFATEQLESRRLFAITGIEQVGGPILDTVAYPPVSETEPGSAMETSFGASVAVNAAGTHALVGSPGTPTASNPTASYGRVSLIEVATGNVVRTFEPTDPVVGTQFGASVAWVGNKIAISAPETALEAVGKIYVYDNASDPTPVIIESVYDTGEDDSIFATRMVAFGDDLVVSTLDAQANGNGVITRYNLDDTATEDVGDIVQEFFSEEATNDQLGSALAVSGSKIYASAFSFEGGGMLPEGLVLEFDANTAAEQVTPTRAFEEPGGGSENNGFGAGIAVAGNSLLVGAFAGNVVYQIDLTATEEPATPLTFLPPPGTRAEFGGFGTAITVSDDGQSVLIGNPLEMDPDTGDLTGAAHLYDLATRQHLGSAALPETAEPFGAFATAMAALPGGRFLISDPWDDADDGTFDTGAVYLFEITEEVEFPTNNAPTVGALTGPAGAVRQQAVTFASSFGDIDAGDDHTVTWDFGDGTVITTAAEAGPLSATHVYGDADTYTVTVTVSDGELSATSSLAFTVTGTGVQGGTLYVGGTDEADPIGINKNGTGGVTVTTADGTINYAGGAIVILAGDGHDTITIGASVTALVQVHGGDGNDTIRGGNGGGILVGDDGDDSLIGGAGRDLLIGGAGADSLSGLPADDVIVAGTTVHDGDPAALGAVYATWASPQTYAVRVNALRTGSLRPDVDVFDDASVDTLAGTSGQDYFIFNNDGVIRDIVLDLKKDELVADVDLIA